LRIGLGKEAPSGQRLSDPLLKINLRILRFLSPTVNIDYKLHRCSRGNHLDIKRQFLDSLATGVLGALEGGKGNVNRTADTA
jgi:hypothetical protein